MLDNKEEANLYLICWPEESLGKLGHTKKGIRSRISTLNSQVKSIRLLKYLPKYTAYYTILSIVDIKGLEKEVKEDVSINKTEFFESDIEKIERIKDSIEKYYNLTFWNIEPANRREGRILSLEQIIGVK